MLQAPPVTAGGMGQASRQERGMKAGLSLHSGACLAGKTGTQGPSCVQLARVTGKQHYQQQGTWTHNSVPGTLSRRQKS